MSNMIDMTGWIMSEHGVPDSRLTVIRQVEERNNGGVVWLCECACSEHNKILVSGVYLRNGTKKSCGCLARENLARLCEQRKKSNQYNLDGEYGIGYTSKGEEFWFDLEDYNLIREYHWYYDSYGYVASNVEVDGKETIVRLHRLVMGDIPNGQVVDHKTHPPRNGLKVDNRKSNLRITTRKGNGRNAALKINNTTGVAGVNYEEAINKYRVRISTDEGVKYLGVYADLEEAAKVRETAEKQYFKDERYNANN